MRILLSPDGYYEYLGIPKPTSAEMDAFLGSKFTNNNTEASTAAASSIDLEKVKKNYRRLSLKHHPDRKSGNAEAFRMLNRAKVVLSNSKLRREYDLLGLDLDDDAEDDDHEHEDEGETVVTTVGESSGEEGQMQDDDNVTSGDAGDDIDAKNSSNNSTNNANEGAHRRRPTKNPSSKSNAGGNDSSKSNNNSGTGGGSGSGGGSKPDTVMGHLASASLAAVLQVVVRTGLMGVVSVLISRYTILVS